jgi:predicted nucleic acid-binding protein
MKQMSGDKVFVDTNVVVYSYSHVEEHRRKQEISRRIMSDNHSVISTQVVQEFANVLVKKFCMEYEDITHSLRECIRNNELYDNTITTVFKACKIGVRYKYAFYDSLIIAAAIESGCQILYSEDMQHKQQIDHKLTIINPYL